MYGRVHGDLFNVPRLLLPAIQPQINFTKFKGEVYVLIAKADIGVI